MQYFHRDDRGNYRAELIRYMYRCETFVRLEPSSGSFSRSAQTAGPEPSLNSPPCSAAFSSACAPARTHVAVFSTVRATRTHLSVTVTRIRRIHRGRHVQACTGLYCQDNPIGNPCPCPIYKPCRHDNDGHCLNRVDIQGVSHPDHECEYTTPGTWNATMAGRENLGSLSPLYGLGPGMPKGNCMCTAGSTDLYHHTKWGNCNPKNPQWCEARSRCAQATRARNPRPPTPPRRAHPAAAREAGQAPLQHDIANGKGAEAKVIETAATARARSRAQWTKRPSKRPALGDLQLTSTCFRSRTY